MGRTAASNGGTVAKRVIDKSMAKLKRHVEKEQQRSQQARAGSEAIIAEGEGQRLEPEERVMSDILQWKQRTLGELEEPEDLLDMQARTWAGSCAICRIRRGARRMHNWRACTEDEEDRSAVRQAHRSIAAAFPASGPVIDQLALPIKSTTVSFVCKIASSRKPLVLSLPPISLSIWSL